MKTWEWDIQVVCPPHPQNTSMGHYNISKDSVINTPTQKKGEMGAEGWESLLHRKSDINREHGDRRLIGIWGPGKILQESWLYSLGSWFYLLSYAALSIYGGPISQLSSFHSLCLPCLSSGFKASFHVMLSQPLPIQAGSISANTIPWKTVWDSTETYQCLGPLDKSHIHKTLR